MLRLADVPAWYARELSTRKEKVDPCEWVVWCECKSEDGSWRRLHDIEEINDHVSDWMEVDRLCEAMIDRNLGFLKELQIHKVRSGFVGESPFQIDPLFHAIMSEDYATLHELRTVYTLKDAYFMLDSITTAKLNEKLAYDYARETAQ